MPIIIQKPAAPIAAMSLADFVSYVRNEVDLNSYESLASVAPYMQALAANKSFFSSEMIKQLKSILCHTRDRDNPYGSNSLIIHQDEDFFIRLNFWKPESDVSEGTEDFFAYEYPHDHNFDFVTVGCHGPGYKTILFEYDRKQVIGYAGESVPLRAIGEEILSEGTVMIFRRGLDVHTQIPPSALSVSLNLMVKIPNNRSEDQYEFDLEQQTIRAYVNPNARETLINLASRLGNVDTYGIIHRIARENSCPRTKLAAIKALTSQGNADGIWRSFANDESSLVRHYAEKQLSL